MAGERITIDLNHATAEELEALPGIGEVLAKRIIAARPLKSVDDLAEIEGIRPALVEQLRPLVTVTPLEPSDEAAEETATEEEAAAEQPSEQAEAESPAAEENPTAEEEQAAPAEADSPEAEEEAEAEQETGETPAEAEEPPTEPKPEKPSEEKYITRRGAWVMSLVMSAVAFFLAIILTLGVLQSINGTLRYGSYASQKGLSRQLAVLQSEVNQTQQSVDSLQRQIADLQNVAEQVNELADRQSAIQKRVKQMKETLNEMQAQVQTTSKFLTGMRDLLNNLLPPATPTQSAPGETPTPTPTSSP